MQLEVLQENFSKALSITSRFANPKAQLPVLGNIYLSGSNNRLLICSTNLEISIATSVGAKVKEAGEITIPGRVMNEVVSNLAPGVINLLSEKETLEISSQNFSSRILGMNAADFPKIPQSLGKNAFSFPRVEFLQCLSQVVFCASVDETRPVLTGVLFLFKKAGVTLVATDGFRLSQKKLKQKGFEKEKNIILPKSALVELSRLVNDEDEISIAIREEDNQVVFGVGDTILTTRVLEGDFPDFEKIIPKEETVKIALDKEELLRGVRLAAVFARDSANIVKVKAVKGEIGLVAESQLAGSQENKVEAKIEGSLPEGGFEISFNFRFLEEFLHAASGDEVDISLSSPSAPGVFTDPSDPDFLHLIMPVRVQS